MSQSLDDLHFPPTVQRLTLDETDITDAGLRKLAESYPNLRRLSLKRCFQLTADGIANFLAKAPKRLATLHLDETAYAGSALPKSINELTLTGCQEMTLDAIHGLAEERGEGTWTLDIGGIAVLSAEDIEKLQSTYPNQIICSEVFTPIIDIAPVQTELQVIDFGQKSLENLVIDPAVTRLQLKGAKSLKWTAADHDKLVAQFPPTLRQLELVEFGLTDKLFVTALAKNCPEGLTDLIIDNCGGQACFFGPLQKEVLPQLKTFSFCYSWGLGGEYKILTHLVDNGGTADNMNRELFPHLKQLETLTLGSITFFKKSLFSIEYQTPRANQYGQQQSDSCL